MNVENEVANSIDAIATGETRDQQEPILRYTSNSYQKILDFHVSEILLTTIILGVVLLLRLHH